MRRKIVAVLAALMMVGMMGTAALGDTTYPEDNELPGIIASLSEPDDFSFNTPAFWEFECPTEGLAPRTRVYVNFGDDGDGLADYGWADKNLYTLRVQYRVPWDPNSRVKSKNRWDNGFPTITENGPQKKRITFKFQDRAKLTHIGFGWWADYHPWYKGANHNPVIINDCVVTPT